MLFCATRLQCDFHLTPRVLFLVFNLESCPRHRWPSLLMSQVHFIMRKVMCSYVHETWPVGKTIGKFPTKFYNLLWETAENYCHWGGRGSWDKLQYSFMLSHIFIKPPLCSWRVTISRKKHIFEKFTWYLSNRIYNKINFIQLNIYCLWKTSYIY